MNFIKIDDLKALKINKTLQDYLDIDTYNFDMDEGVAIGMVRTYLKEIYDLSGEMAKTNTNRNNLLIKIICDIMYYNLYQKLAPQDIPEYIVNNYNDTIIMIDNAQKRVLTLDIDLLPKESNDMFRFSEVDSGFQTSF